MKNIKNIWIVFLACFFSACGNDWLDTTPATSVETETALTRLEDFEYVLNGIYSKMQSEEYYGARMQYYGDVTGDDAQANSSTKRCASYYLFKFTKDSAPSSFWSRGYSIIGETNTVINDIDKLLIEEGDKTRRDELKGQALALRALALFDLTRLYGYTYLKDNGASWGAVIVKEAEGTGAKPKRSTVAQCYTEIISDLTTAIPMLSQSASKGKINSWAAMTLLSRVYLYKGDNANAFTTAENAIKGAEAKSFKLWSNAEYQAAWAKEYTSEVFFEIVNLLTDGPGKESMGYLCAEKGYDDIILTYSFMELMNKDKSDVRYKLIKKVTKKEVDRYYIMKYPGQAGETIAEANIPVFRISELYLNAAEAAVKLADNPNAVKYLDAIVKRGNPAKTVVGTTVTLDRVLDERRKEFFGEGQRMFDALRNNQTVERRGASHLPLVDYAVKFDRTFYKSVMPIPKYEMDANENMRDQQNPEY